MHAEVQIRWAINQSERAMLRFGQNAKANVV